MLRHVIILVSCFMFQSLYGGNRLDSLVSATHEKITVLEGRLIIDTCSDTHATRYFLESNDTRYHLLVPRHFISIARSANRKWVEVRGVLLEKPLGNEAYSLKVKNLVPVYKKKELTQ